MQGIISSVGNIGGGGSTSMNYLPATPIVPYPALVDGVVTLNSNLFTGSTNNSIYGNDDGGNPVNVSSTTFGAGDLRSLLTSFLDLSSSGQYFTMDVNTGNKYITQLDISRESGTSLTAKIQWYHSDVYVTEESVTIASGSSHIFTPPDTLCNIAKIVLTKGTTAVYRCRIRVSARLTCQANNIDIPGVMYAILPEFPLPSTGKNKIRSINSTYYADYSTNYSTGLFLISYNGSIIDYHT